jgi:hypothetical protein
MSQDAAIGLWTSDLLRAACAFTRPSQYGSAVLAMVGLGPGRRSLHFDWIGSSLAVVGSKVPDVHLGFSLPKRTELPADLLAIVYSWIVIDPYETFHDASLTNAASPHDAMSGAPRSVVSIPFAQYALGACTNSGPRILGQKQEKNHAFKALESWATNKFSMAASKFDVGTEGTKTLISCFHASSPDDPATIAISLVSPHKNWPFDADDRTIEDWKIKTCHRIKSVASKNAAASIKGSVVIYFPCLVDSFHKKIWKPSAPEMKRCYEDLCGGSSDVSFVCMSPWEVLEVTEYLHSNVPESQVTRDIVTDVWTQCLPVLSPLRGVQESIYDQSDEAKFMSYGWPDVTRSHVPRVQTITRCSSAVVRSVLIGCCYLMNQEDQTDDRDQTLDCCLFDSVSVGLFDEITTFSQKLFECFISSRAAPVKEVVLLFLEVSLELFEEVLSSLENLVVPTRQTRNFIQNFDALVDIDSISSSSDEILHAMNAWQSLIQAFGDGLKQLKNARKIETLDQCEAVAKCTISIVNSLLKCSEFPAPLSPNRRWRDDELWKGVLARPHALLDQCVWKPHCQSISDFITTASFCGIDKNCEFPNGRLLDSSYHRSVASQSIQTLLFFVCNTVLHGLSSTEHEVVLPRNLVLLQRSKSGNKSIQNMTADAIQRFQMDITRLKKIQPQKSPPPPTQIKPVVLAPKAVSSSTPRRRSLNASRECQSSDTLSLSASTISEQPKLAPGLRVLHDVQVFEHDISGVLSEDCRSEMFCLSSVMIVLIFRRIVSR